MASTKSDSDDKLSIKFVKSLWWEATHYTPLPIDCPDEKVGWGDDFISLEEVKRIASRWAELADVMERRRKRKLLLERISNGRWRLKNDL